MNKRLLKVSAYLRSQGLYTEAAQIQKLIDDQDFVKNSSFWGKIKETLGLGSEEEKKEKPPDPDYPLWMGASTGHVDGNIVHRWVKNEGGEYISKPEGRKQYVIFNRVKPKHGELGADSLIDGPYGDVWVTTEQLREARRLKKGMDADLRERYEKGETSRLMTYVMDPTRF